MLAMPMPVSECVGECACRCALLACRYALTCLACWYALACLAYRYANNLSLELTSMTKPSTVHGLGVTIDAFVHTWDITIPVLQVVRGTSRKILVKETIIDDTDLGYVQWATLLLTKKTVFEGISYSCNQIEGTIHPIQDKIFDLFHVILGRRIEIETNVSAQELEGRLKVIFCKEESISTEEQRDQMHSIMYLIDRTRELEQGWKVTIHAAYNDVLQMEDEV